MAVEIPVVVDIEEAFKDAAKKVATAGKPLETSVEALSDRLTATIEKMNHYQVDSNQWKGAVKEVQRLTEMLDLANDKMQRFGSNTGSIKQLSAELSRIERQWEKLGESQKYDKRGAFSTNANKLISDYKAVTAEIQRTGRTLAQMAAEEQRLQSLRAKGLQSRRYENAIMSSGVKTMQVLQEQERILSERLSRTTIGSSKYEKLKVDLLAVTAEMKRLGTTTAETNLNLKAQVPILGQLANMAGMYVSVFSAYRLIHNIREVTAEFEKQKIALAALVQSQAVANELFEQLKTLALQSPFQFMELTTYTKQLSAYQIESDKLYDTTKRLADMSAGLGVDMSRLILAYGQVRAASVLRGQELRQFTEAGIPLVNALAEKFSKLTGEMVSTADVFQLISERAVPFEMIDEIFHDMTDEGGRFYNMQEKLAQTLAGQWSNLKDAIQITFAEIGETEEMQEVFKGVIWAVKALGRHWRDLVSAIKVGTVAWAALKVVKLNNAIATRALTAAEAKEMMTEKGLLIYKRNLLGRYKLVNGQKVIAERRTRRLQAAQMRLARSTNILSFSIAKLRLAFASNPLGFIGGVIGLAATAFSFFTDKAKEATEATEEVAKTTDDYIRGTESAVDTVVKYYTRTEKSIRRYEELSKVTERSTQQQDEFLRLQRELIKEFPSVAGGIDQVTGAIEAETDAIRAARDAELGRKREAAEASLSQLVNRQKALLGTVEDLRKYQELLDQLGRQQFTGEDIYDAFRLFEGQNVTQNFERAANVLTQIQGALKGDWYVMDFFKRIQEEGARDNIITDFIKYSEEYESTTAAITRTVSTLASLRELLDGFTGWKKFFSEQKKITSLGTETMLYTEQEIQNFKSLDEALDDVAKKYKDAKASRDQLEKSFASMVITEDERSKIKAELDVSTALERVLYAILEHYNALGLLQTRGGSGGHQTDPFVTQMKDRIKFMKDFQKGYDELQKHLSSRRAENREASIMLGRGLSLGLTPDEQRMAADNLRQWYRTQIYAVMDEMKKKGAKGTSVTEILGEQFSDKTNWGKTMKEWQGLLQELWDSATDLDNKKLTDNLEKTLKDLQESIKRTETARNFYRDILDLTGDEDMAANISLSVYGDVGAEFKQRIQAQLDEALRSLDTNDIDETLREAFAKQDFATILKNLDKFPEKWQETLKKMAEDSEKYNADRAKDLIKALKDAKTYGEKRVELARQTAKRMADIDAMEVSDEVKNQFRKQNLQKDAEETARLQYEAFKDTPLYIQLFASLDTATTEMLTRMKNRLVEMKSQWKDLSPKDLKELQSRITEIDEQLASRNPFEARLSAWKRYHDMLKEMSREEAEQNAVEKANARVKAERDLERAIQDVNNQQMIYNAIVEEKGEGSAEAQLQLALLNRAKKREKVAARTADKAKEEADAAENIAIAYDDAQKAIVKSTEAIATWVDSLNSAVTAAKDLVSVFASNELTEDVEVMAEGISKALSGASKFALGATRASAGDMTGLVDAVAGVADFATGIFGTASKLRIASMDRQIQAQTRLIDELEYSYGRLEDAISKSFGSDYIYNYNEQLQILEAKRQAYLRQAALERNKGVKADKDQIREYQNAAREVQDQIDSMRQGLAEFFSGTDVTSAARDFADAWINAYREFGSTTSAMSEQFEAMVENMVKNSLAAQLMQNLLQPIFDEIQAASETGGQLTSAEIAHIAEMSKQIIPQINESMEVLMSELTAAGINMRQSASGLTGISRNVANASEESILGLAAGINTQNYYMSYVPTISENVSSILTILGGAPAVGKSSAGTPQTVPYEDQMLEYASGATPRKSGRCSKRLSSRSG